MRTRLLSCVTAFLLFCVVVPPLTVHAQGGPFVPQPVADITQTGTITSVNVSVGLPMAGQSSCTLNIIGTWSGTLQFQGTTDNVTWVALPLAPYGTPGTTQTSFTGNNLYVGACVGLTQVRVFSTAWTSGTATVTLHGAYQSGASIGSGGGGGGGTVNQGTAGSASWLVACTSGCSSSAPLTGGSTGVTPAANQSVALHVFNGTTLDAAHGFTFSGTPGWIASAAAMYDPASGKVAQVTQQPGDAVTNPTGGYRFSFAYGFSGTAWDQLRETPAGSPVTGGTAGVLNVQSIGAGGAFPIVNSGGGPLAINGTGPSNTVVVSQSSGSNLHTVCDSGCGAAPGWKYTITTTTALTVIKNAPGLFAGITNLSTSAQTGGMTCTWYDNASAASGNVLYTATTMGAGQILTFGSGAGVQTTNGLTMQCTGGTPGGSGVQTLWSYQPHRIYGARSQGWHSARSLTALDTALGITP